ncbi:MAG: HAD-IA family hydrolase [Fimbriimonadales bacterium]
MERPAGFRAILFDIDGTLIDTVALIVSALDHTYRKHLGIQLPPQEIRRLIGLPLKVQMHYLDDRVDRPIDHELLEHDEIAYYQANRHQEQPIQQALESVRTAYERGFAIGLVTSKNRAELAFSWERLGLDNWVDVVVTADDTERHKPNPEPVLKALEWLGVPPEQAIYIGDTVFDLSCGRSAGTQVAAVGWGAHLPEDLRSAQPDYYFETPADLLEWVQQVPLINDHGKAKEDDFRDRKPPFSITRTDTG